MKSYEILAHIATYCQDLDLDNFLKDNAESLTVALQKMQGRKTIELLEVLNDACDLDHEFKFPKSFMQKSIKGSRLSDSDFVKFKVRSSPSSLVNCNRWFKDQEKSPSDDFKQYITECSIIHGDFEFHSAIVLGELETGKYWHLIDNLTVSRYNRAIHFLKNYVLDKKLSTKYPSIIRECNKRITKNRLQARKGNKIRTI